MDVVQLDDKMVRNWIETSLAIYSETKQISLEEAKSILIIGLGTSVRQLGYWINNTSQPSLEEALKISEILGRPVADIFKLTEI